LLLLHALSGNYPIKGNIYAFYKEFYVSSGEIARSENE
jgi:hypothetical protein